MWEYAVWSQCGVGTYKSFVPIFLVGGGGGGEYRIGKTESVREWQWYGNYSDWCQ